MEARRGRLHGSGAIGDRLVLGRHVGTLVLPKSRNGKRDCHTLNPSLATVGEVWSSISLLASSSTCRTWAAAL